VLVRRAMSRVCEVGPRFRVEAALRVHSDGEREGDWARWAVDVARLEGTEGWDALERHSSHAHLGSGAEENSGLVSGSIGTFLLPFLFCRLYCTGYFCINQIIFLDYLKRFRNLSVSDFVQPGWGVVL
jgi:hypothetical protein